MGPLKDDLERYHQWVAARQRMQATNRSVLSSLKHLIQLMEDANEDFSLTERHQALAREAADKLNTWRTGL